MVFIDFWKLGSGYLCIGGFVMYFFDLLIDGLECIF